MYFKVFISKSGSKKSGKARRRFIQSFLRICRYYIPYPRQSQRFPKGWPGAYFLLCRIPYHKGGLDMKKHWKVYAFWILLSEAAGGLSGWLSREGMQVYEDTVTQPPMSPPMFLFPIVWGILYALMGISAARIWLAEPSKNRSRGLNLFIAQLVVNFFWSLIFFNLQAFGLALLWLVLLWVLVLGMILTFRRVDPLAAWLQVPYLLWLTFAAWLTWGVWRLNP